MMNNLSAGKLGLKSWLKRRTLLSAFAASLVTAGLVGSQVHAQEQPAKAPEASLEQKLEGTWVYVGKPGEATSPGAGVRFKTLQQGILKLVQKDPKTGAEIYHHGGVYTIDGDQYAEEVTYSSEKRPELINQTFRFTIKIEGDKLTQTGVGNPWTEVWKRVK